MKTKHLLLSVFLMLSACLFSQIPQLNSVATVTNRVIYLDFDGQVVTGTLWNSGSTVNALPSTISAANMLNVWKRVSEDFRPFDVNVTTDSTRFNSAPATQRTRVVVTPTSAWYGAAGGVAYLGSFAWGGTPGTPCWVFENQLGYSAKNIAEACSHEIGHTLSLRHQSTYTGTCVKSAEYNPGQGTGVTGWAPIMGVGYSRNVTTWYTGTSSSSCTTIQYDHGNVLPGITGPNFLNFIPDDVGDTYATGKTLNLATYNLLDSGIITTPGDIDVYKFTICNTRTISVAIKPWALDTVAYNGANLDVRFQLFNSANTLLATDTSLARLNTLAALSLTPGAYYFTVDGGRSSNYNDYGSLGKYYLNIKTTDPPLMSNTIVASPTTCAGQATNFSALSNGVPAYWLWNFAGPSPTISIISSPLMTFPTPGIYTVSLSAFNNFSISCVVTQTLNVGSTPVLTVSPGSTVCPGTIVNVTAAGALLYSWMPGNLGGPLLSLSPSVSTVYTVTGNNGMCSSQATMALALSPDFSVNISASSTLVCPGQSIVLSATGANSYTFYPGNLAATSISVIPQISTNYTVTGSNGLCNRSSIKFISLSPDFSLLVDPTSTILCEGESIFITASGAASYTLEPGSFNGSPVFISPAASTEYTITGANADNCLHKTTSSVSVSVCESITEAHHILKSIEVFPIPATGEITVSGLTGSEKISIVNALGEIVFEKAATVEKVDLSVSSWPGGFYVLQIYSSGKENFTQKIIIQH